MREISVWFRTVSNAHISTLLILFSKLIWNSFKCIIKHRHSNLCKQWCLFFYVMEISLYKVCWLCNAISSFDKWKQSDHMHCYEQSEFIVWKMQMKPAKISLSSDLTKILAHFWPNEKKMLLFIFFVNHVWQIKYTCRSQLFQQLFQFQITLQIHSVGINSVQQKKISMLSLSICFLPICQKSAGIFQKSI